MILHHHHLLWGKACLKWTGAKRIIAFCFYLNSSHLFCNCNCKIEKHNRSPFKKTCRSHRQSLCATPYSFSLFFCRIFSHLAPCLLSPPPSLWSPTFSTLGWLNKYPTKQDKGPSAIVTHHLQRSEGDCRQTARKIKGGENRKRDGKLSKQSHRGGGPEGESLCERHVERRLDGWWRVITPIRRLNHLAHSFLFFLIFS